MARFADLFIMGAMNYRHAFHAGNFADVMKHVALVSIVLHLKKKPAAFVVIDTHAGRGLYDLTGAEAQRSSEAAWGIDRVRDLAAGPDALGTYLGLVRSCGDSLYPGSPMLAAKMLRSDDRLVAIEKHPGEAGALKVALAPYRRTRVVDGDGYVQLPALLPPPERRGIVLIDPPYEEADEFKRVVSTVTSALRRFATGTVVVWFPIKSVAAANAFSGEILAAGPNKVILATVDVGELPGRMGAAGLLVVNPPFGFEAEMRAALAVLAPKLGRAGPANARLDWLAGSQ